MNFTSKTALTAALLVSVAACNKSDNGNNQLVADNSAGMNVSAGEAASAANPFADAEKQMSDKMMAAVGSDAGQSWAKKMIEHHEGAMAMSRIVLDRNPSADVAKMARESIDKNQKDIVDIKKLLKDGAPDQKSGDLYRPAMIDMQEHMTAAKGADVSESFMRKMLEHHKGAVAMSDVALKNGVSGALRAQVDKTKKMNQDDAKMVDDMLNGKSMDRAKADNSSKGMPVPGTKTPEHVAHDMNHMGNMDMNHM